VLQHFLVAVKAAAAYKLAVFHSGSMARIQSRRGRRAANCLVASGMALLAVHHWNGPAYVVKSSWDGEPESLKDYAGIVKGLEPSVALPALSFERGDGLVFSVDQGHLAADYKGQLGKDTSLDVSVNDAQDWTAALESGKSAVKVRGQGPSLEGASWEAWQSGSADGVGDVSLYFNSGKDYKLSVANDDLGEVAGTSFSGKLTAEPAGMVGHLEARRNLPGNVGAKFTHENPVGDYDLNNATETAEFTMDLAVGQAALKLAYANQAPEYEAAYSRAIKDGQADVHLSLKNGGVGYNASYNQNVNGIADVLVGLDQSGVYGTLSASKDVAEGLGAQYEARGRATLDNEGTPSFSHTLKLSSKLGYAQLLHGLDEKPRLKLGYEFNVNA